jgi:hypothetical protein
MDRRTLLKAVTGAGTLAMAWAAGVLGVATTG